MTGYKNEQELFYKLALTFAPGIGIKTGKVLLDRLGSAEAIFSAPLKEIKSIDGISEVKAKGFKDKAILEKATAEMEYAAKHDITILAQDDTRYPQRLINCSDAPLILFYKGNADLNAQKIVAIVGTRKSTEYGVKMTEDLVTDLQEQEGLLITSGLAYGIDAIAHKRSVALGIPTVGALGHGLDRIYPASNRPLSKDMVQNGGLLSEFPSGTLPDRANFPMRNRIVAGMSDITVVVESDIAGGALITARMANSYNRDVMAFPGRVGDARSAGCNELIRNNIAALITKADDLLDLMNWNKGKKRKPVQKQLFLNLLPEEQQIIDFLQAKDAVHSDELLHHTGLSNSQLAATLLQLEMQGLIKTLPGKQYRLY